MNLDDVREAMYHALTGARDDVLRDLADCDPKSLHGRVAMELLDERQACPDRYELCGRRFGSKSCVLVKGHGGMVHVSNSGTSWGRI